MADDRHEDKSDRDGSKEHYDHSKTEDVSESGGGKHDKEDRDDE